MIQREWKRKKKKDRDIVGYVCVWGHSKAMMTQKWGSFKQYNFPLVSQVTRKRKTPSGWGTQSLNRTEGVVVVFFFRNFQLPVYMYACVSLHLYSERGRWSQIGNLRFYCADVFSYCNMPVNAWTLLFGLPLIDKLPDKTNRIYLPVNKPVVLTEPLTLTEWIRWMLSLFLWMFLCAAVRNIRLACELA